MDKNIIPDLESATFTFSQEVNCMSDADIETITIDCKSSAGIEFDKGAFFVLHTGEAGWAIDTPEDMAELLQRCKDMLSISPKSNKNGEKGK